jgi:hypothetical protein
MSYPAVVWVSSVYGYRNYGLDESLLENVQVSFIEGIGLNNYWAGYV